MGSGNGGRTGASPTGLAGGGFSMAAMATLLSSRPVTNSPILAPGPPVGIALRKGRPGQGPCRLDPAASRAMVRGSTNGASVIPDWYQYHGSSPQSTARTGLQNLRQSVNARCNRAVTDGCPVDASPTVRRPLGGASYGSLRPSDLRRTSPDGGARSRFGPAPVDPCTAGGSGPRFRPGRTRSCRGCTCTCVPRATALASRPRNGCTFSTTDTSGRRAGTPCRAIRTCIPAAARTRPCRRR